MLARVRAVGLAIFLCGCSATAHIDLKFDVQLDSQCQAAAPGNPPAPMTCSQLTMDCADHLLFRVRQDENQQPGDIINSRCPSLAQVGSPRDLCALGDLKEPVSLIDSVPYGTRFIFQLAALKLLDPNGGCDNDVAPPLRVFSGLSDPVLVDGQSHTLTIHLASCGSCSNLPPMGGQDGAAASDLGASLGDLATASDAASFSDGGLSVDLASGADLLQSLCPPGEAPSPYHAQGGAFCCPSPLAESCSAPGAQCPDGTLALLPPGGCCAVCD